MSELVRKQVYIHERQQRLLRRLSEAQGISESEIVRRALEREATGTSSWAVPPDRAAWEEILDFVKARKVLVLGTEGSKPYKWNREDAYLY